MGQTGKLSDEAVQRLKALGYSDASLSFWSQVWQSQDEEFFWDILEGEEDVAARYREWFPRLEAFAAECRRSRPAPAVSELSAAEHAQHHILLEKMREYAASKECSMLLGRRHNRTTVLSSTHVGLAAAIEVFGTADVIILEESERERWFDDVYRPESEDVFWWYAFLWWTLRDDLDEETRRAYDIPTDGAYWVVDAGVRTGSLAGTSFDELWRWDGQRAEFIRGLSVTCS